MSEVTNYDTGSPVIWTLEMDVTSRKLPFRKQSKDKEKARDQGVCKEAVSYSALGGGNEQLLGEGKPNVFYFLYPYELYSTFNDGRDCVEKEFYDDADK